MTMPRGHPTMRTIGAPSIYSITNTKPGEGIHVSLTKWRKLCMLIISEEDGYYTICSCMLLHFVIRTTL